MDGKVYEAVEMQPKIMNKSPQSVFTKESAFNVSEGTTKNSMQIKIKVKERELHNYWKNLMYKRFFGPMVYKINY